MNKWYSLTVLDDECCYNTHCKDCEPNGNCDVCETIDGRYMEAVNDYASTCDVCCELTHHDLFAYIDPVTQLGCCESCFEKGNLPGKI